MKTSPPKFATRLLTRFCNVEFLEEVEGDLHEQFQERRLKYGIWRARVFYFIDVLQAIRTYPLKRTGIGTGQRLPLFDLVGHFFKVALRNIARSKATGAINIIGFAVSITSFLLIALYILDEVSYDTFHPDSENVYRIGYTYKRFGDGVEETDARAAGLWSVALKESMPEVRTFTRFSRFGYPGTLRSEKHDKVFVEQQFFWVDSTYLDIFNLEIISGDSPERILKNPNAVILTEAAAKKYFGDDSPQGETLIYSRDGMDFPLTVAGVMRSYPSNAHFHPDFIASNQALVPLWRKTNEDRVNSWGDAFTYSYLKLDEGTGAAKLEKELRRVFDSRLGDDAKFISPSVVKMTDIHFTPGKVIELENPGNKANLYIFGSIGILILVIASINYMNLATARSIKRSKEVGLRKALGVGKSALVIQFIGESILITAFAAALSSFLLGLALPFFNEVAGKSFAIVSLLNFNLLAPILAAIFLLAVLSGIYPAFYLSSFKPVEVLKGQMRTGRGAESFRRVLVVFQFSVTVLLLAGTIAIDRQMKFLYETKLGEHQDEMLTVRLNGMIDQAKIEPLINNLKQNSTIADVSMGTHIPRQDHYGWIDTRVKANSLGQTEYIWQQLDVAPNFPSVFNLELIEGRSFASIADTAYVLINETALKDLRINASDAIGLQLENPFTKVQRTVIGVVKDFNYTSARKKIEPLVMNCYATNADMLYVKLATNNYQAGVEQTEKAWKKVSPLSPFEFSFLNAQFDTLYRIERQASMILKYFAVLAIAIACLGLFGLATFIAEQRTKEIGIRKVLGASASQILVLLTSRFMKLIIISLIIGTPLAYFAITNWLNSFAYRIDINLFYFIIPALLILFISCVTVTIETLRAAYANPVRSIRHD